jgi:hypothetical protein
MGSFSFRLPRLLFSSSQTNFPADRNSPSQHTSQQAQFNIPRPAAAAMPSFWRSLWQPRHDAVDNQEISNIPSLCPLLKLPLSLCLQAICYPSSDFPPSQFHLEYPTRDPYIKHCFKTLSLREDELQKVMKLIQSNKPASLPISGSIFRPRRLTFSAAVRHAHNH